MPPELHNRPLDHVRVHVVLATPVFEELQGLCLLMRLLALVDRGVSVKEAAGVVGVGLQRAYLLLREVRGPMRKRSRITDELRVEVIKAFDRSGSPYRAGLDCGISESAARRVLVQNAYATWLASEPPPMNRPK